MEHKAILTVNLASDFKNWCIDVLQGVRVY